MALNGTLDDMNIIDLIQFPHSGSKSGELVIANNNKEAKLFYDQGNLVHASMGTLDGEDVLVEVVDWHKGEFEFHKEKKASKKSIEKDLHKVLMNALKASDDRKQQQSLEIAESTFDIVNNDLSQVLKNCISANESVLFTCILNNDGAIQTQAQNEEITLEFIDIIIDTLQILLKSYPRKGFSKLVLEDDSGVVALSRLDSEKKLVLIVDKGTPMGAASMTMAKLASNIKQGQST